MIGVWRQTTSPPGIALAAGVGLFLVLFGRDSLAASRQSAAVTVAIVAAACLVALGALRGDRAVTLGVVYFLTFAFFHAGLAPFLLLDSLPEVLSEPYRGHLPWYRSPELPEAAVCVAVGMLAFLTGYALWRCLIPVRSWFRTARTAGTARTARTAGPAAGPRPDAPDVPVDRPGDHAAMSLLGMVLLPGGMLLLFSVILERGAASFVTEDYGSFYAAAYRPRLVFAFLFVGIGMAILGGSRSPSLRRRAALIFVPFAAVAFTAGFRGAVIFPAAAYLVALGRRRIARLRAWHLAPLVLALTAGSIVRQLRQTGVARADPDTVTVNPLDGVAELGATLRTVVVVHEWHGPGREPFVGWDTYLASAERLFLGRLLGLDVIPAATDPRVFTAVVAERTGGAGIGGSPTAEAYRAAGLVGVVVVMAVIGLLVAWLDSRPAGGLGEYLVGMVGYVLLVWSRNDVAPVLVQIAFCLALLALARLLGVLSRSDRRPDPGPRRYALAGRAD